MLTSYSVNLPSSYFFFFFFVNSKNLILRLNDRDEATRTCLRKKKKKKKKEERTKEKERTRLVQSDNWKRPKRESGQDGWWIFQRGSRLRIMGRKRKGLCRGNSWKRTCRGFRFTKKKRGNRRSVSGTVSTPVLRYFLVWSRCRPTFFLVAYLLPDVSSSSVRLVRLPFPRWEQILTYTRRNLDDILILVHLV